MTTALKTTSYKKNGSQSKTEALAIGNDMHVGISGFGAWMLGVGSIIGSMAWLFHGPMIARAGALGSLTAWVVATIMMIPLVLILMELSSMFPSAGGPYIYKYYALKRLVPGLGELLGFLTGWLFWICLIVGLACMSNGLSNLLAANIWGTTANSPVWFGPLIIFALFAVTTCLNLQKVGSAARLNNLFTLMKLAMAIGFGVLVAISPTASVANAFQPLAPTGSDNLLVNVSAVLMLALAGFGGIEMATCTSSETKDARRTVPRCVFMTLLTVGFIYAAMCIAVSSASPLVLSPDKSTMIVAGTAVQANCPSIAGLVGGSIWGTIFTAAVVASIVGCGFSCLLGNARVAYSMAKTGLFPDRFARLDEKTKVPRYALWFQFLCLTTIGVTANLMSRTGVFPDAYTFLAEVFGFLYAFIALLYGVCAISLRYTDPDMPRPFRIGANGHFLLWVLTLLTVSIWGYAAFGCVGWTHQFAGALIIAAGIPVYAYYRWRK